MTRKEIIKADNNINIATAMLTATLNDEQQEELMTELLTITTSILLNASLRYEIYEACKVLQEIEEILNRDGE